VTLSGVQTIAGFKSFNAGLESFNTTLRDVCVYEKGNSKIRLDADNSNVMLQTSHKFQNPVNIAMIPTGFVGINNTTPRSQLSVKGGLTLESLNGYDSTNKIDFVHNWAEQWDQLRLHTALTPSGGTFCISKLNSQQSNLVNMLSINPQQLSISSNTIVQSGVHAVLCVNPAKPKNHFELASGDGFCYIDIHAGEVSSSDFDVRLIAFGKTLQLEGELLKVQMPLQVTGLSTMQAIACSSVSASGPVSCTSLTANSINAPSLSSTTLASASLALTSDDAWMINLNRTNTQNAFGCGLQFKTDNILNAQIYGGRSDFAWNYSYLAIQVQNNQVLNSGTYRGADFYIDHDGCHIKNKLEFLYEADPASQWKIYPLGNMRLGFYRGALQAFVDYNGSWVALSDARKKINIKTLDPEKSLVEITRLRPVAYHLTTQPQGFTKKSIGFIAQEVEEVNPHCVSTLDDDDSTKLLSYQDLFTHALNAIKALSQKVTVLSRRIEQLEEKYSSA
jgi:hypothetical protein